MLVYEFMPNGTLRDHLSGTPYIHPLSLPFIDLTTVFSACEYCNLSFASINFPSPTLFSAFFELN
jgi:hypothetical protein